MSDRFRENPGYRLSPADLDRIVNSTSSATELSWAVKDLLCAHYELEELPALRVELATLKAQLDEQNGILGEMANTPSGAIIAALKAKLAIYETALDNIDRYGMPEQYEQRTASEALAAGRGGG